MKHAHACAMDGPSSHVVHATDDLADGCRSVHRDCAVESGPAEAASRLSRPSCSQARPRITSAAERACLFVAFGTRGDVLPLFLLARVVSMREHRRVTFVTHAAHRPRFDWQAAGLRFVGTATDHTQRAANVQDEYEPAIAAAAHSDFVVFNLFALGAWHIAEALGLRAVAASPCLIPYSHPSGFRASFAASFPRLYASLSSATDGQVGWADVEHWMWPLWTERWGEWRRERLGKSEIPFEGCEAGRDSLPPPTPVLYGVSPLLAPPPSYWPRSAVSCGFWLEAEAVDMADELISSGQWGKASGQPNVQCLALGSRLEPILLAERGGGLRDGTTGQHRSVHSSGRAKPAMHSDPLSCATLARVLRGIPVVYLGFGSASAALLDIGLAPDLARAAIAVAGDLGLPLVLHSCGNAALAACWREAVAQARGDGAGSFGAGQGSLLRREDGDGGDPAVNIHTGKTHTATIHSTSIHTVTMHTIDGAVNLQQLFNHCALVLHHGGCGTVATALHAGVPQVILPLHFDQFSWAERVEHAGVGLRLHPPGRESQSQKQESQSPKRESQSQSQESQSPKRESQSQSQKSQSPKRESQSPAQEMHDQISWAERVEHAGLGVRPHSLGWERQSSEGRSRFDQMRHGGELAAFGSSGGRLSTSELNWRERSCPSLEAGGPLELALRRAVQRCLSVDVTAQCVAMAEELRVEGGLTRAAALLKSFMGDPMVMRQGACERASEVAQTDEGVAVRTPSCGGEDASMDASADVSKQPCGGKDASMDVCDGNDGDAGIGKRCAVPTALLQAAHAWRRQQDASRADPPPNALSAGTRKREVSQAASHSAHASDPPNALLGGSLRSAQAPNPAHALPAGTRKRSRLSGEDDECSQHSLSTPSGATNRSDVADPAAYVCAATVLDLCPHSPDGEGGALGELQLPGGGEERAERLLVRDDDEGEEEVLLPNGVTIWSRALSEAMHIYEEVWLRSSYLPRGSGLVLPASPLVVDVGANIGLFSLWLCGSTPGARVIAVEPAPPNVDLLVRNLHRAGLSHHIHVVRAALGAASGRGVLHYYPCMPGNSTLLPCVKWRDRVAFRPDRWAAMFARREYPCEVLTLSCVLRAHARVGQEVDLLKIDAEGSEVDVLRGVNEADWPRIWQVAVEVHGDVMRERVTEILASRHLKIETRKAAAGIAWALMARAGMPRYAHVCFHPDDDLRACGLERGVVTARTRVGRRASGAYAEALAEHKMGECTVTA